MAIFNWRESPKSKTDPAAPQDKTSHSENMPSECNSRRGLVQNEGSGPSSLGYLDALHQGQGQGSRVLANTLDERANAFEIGCECHVVELKPVVADAHHALALYHYRKASAALKNMQFQFAANYLALAAKHLDRAAECSDTHPNPEIRRTTEEAREFVRKLLEQSGSAVEGTGPMMQSLGQLIERLGERIGELQDHLA